MRYKFCKDPSKENKCVSLLRKCIKSYFQDVTEKGFVTNKSFWNFDKPFLTNKWCHTQNDTMLIDNGKAIIKQRNLAETFDGHYINIVEETSVQKPCKFVSDTHSLEDDVFLTK